MEKLISTFLSIPIDFLMLIKTKEGIDIGASTNTLISENILFIIVYSILATLTIIIMIINNVNKRNKYRRLKSQTVNIGIYSAKWEFTEDDFLKQLCEDNERLENRVKVLSKEITNLSFVAFMVAMVFLLPYYVKEKFKKN